MASNLDNELMEILAGEPEEVKKDLPKEQQVEEQAEATENSEVEGVEEAAETSSEDSQDKEEGDKIPSELEEELKNIDPEVREAILNASPELRESQIKAFKKMRATVDRKLTEIGQEKKIAETTRQLFKEYNLDENRGFDQIKSLVEFEKKLKQDPKSVIKSLGEMFQIESEVAGSEDNIDIESLTDNERILYNKIKKTEDEAKKAREEANNIKRLNESKEEERIFQEIIAVKDAVNEDGSLKNPYFDEVLPDMERLHNLYPNLNTQQLYNKAVRLNDVVYEKSIEEKKNKQLSLTLLEKEEALKKAKNINSQSLKHSSSSLSPPKSIDDVLGDIIDKSQSY